MAIDVKAVPVEAHNSVEKVERYHSVFKQAFEIIQSDFIRLNLEVALQIAIKTINDIASPNGIVSILLVFGAYFRITRDSLLLALIIQRAKVI